MLTIPRLSPPQRHWRATDWGDSRNFAVVWRGDASLPAGKGVKTWTDQVRVWSFLNRRNSRLCGAFVDVRFNEGELLVECVRPDLSGAFAHRHDASVWECLRQILRITPEQAIASATASLPFFMGGLGFMAAFRSREGLIGQTGLIASLGCKSATPQWQTPWCKGWPGLHASVQSEREVPFGEC